MKQHYLRMAMVGALALASVTATLAQNTSRTVTLGAQYKDQVFFSMKNGVLATRPLAEWDIAFENGGFSASIIINGGNGVELYSVPGRTAEQWSMPVDTTGMSGWERHNNSVETWTSGAFNMGRDYNTGDFGWGEYNMVTHQVTATTIFVARLPGNVYKKIMIDGLASGTYSFRYADLDGSNEQTASLSKSNYPGKNFMYYSVKENSPIDREPLSAEWDLLFTRYIDMAGPNLDLPYGVTGVLSNRSVGVAQVATSSPASEPAPGDEAFTDKINEIGYDWKTFAGTAYTISDDRAYFVKARDGGIYRLLFTSFAGGSTGEMTFTTELLGLSSVGTMEEKLGTFALHPNIVSRRENLTLVYELKPGDAELAIHDLTGAVVAHADLSTGEGLRRMSIPVDLPAGVYIATVKQGGAIGSMRFIVR